MEKDALLERIVEKILLELFEAQKASNQASARLVEEYMDDKNVGPIQFFPIPNSCIKKFDFSLKFLLKDLGIIITDNAKEALSEYVMSAWVDIIEKLFQVDCFSSEKKKLMLVQKPVFNLDDIHQIVSPREKTIVGRITSIVKNSFYNALLLNQVNYKDEFETAFANVNFEENINLILFEGSDDQKFPLSSIKASFDLGKLSELTEDIICDINVNVEMRNFESAYVDKVSEDNPTEVKRTILNLRHG